MVEFYTAFQDENYYYIVMEYCSGGDLLEYLLNGRKAMSERRCAVEVVLPLLTTLARLHELNVIHRDIKLENIFLDAYGKVRLGDFGLTMSQRQEAAISPVGTVEYMAPEVVALPSVEMVTSGRIRASTIAPTDEKVDIWALGVTIYELVTGRLPFEGKDKAEIKAAITAYHFAAFPPYVSTQCQGIIKSMLAYDREQRPGAAELLGHQYLQTYCRAPSASGATVTLEVRAGPPRSLGQNQDPAFSGKSQIASNYQDPNGGGTPPGPPLTSLPTPMSASSREISSSSLARASPDPRAQSGSTASAAAAAARAAGSGAWAALRRLSGGHPGQKGNATESEVSTQQGKQGVKGAMQRLFNRQSAPHRVNGGQDSSR